MKLQVTRIPSKPLSQLLTLQHFYEQASKQIEEEEALKTQQAEVLVKN